MPLRRFIDPDSRNHRKPTPGSSPDGPGTWSTSIPKSVGVIDDGGGWRAPLMTGPWLRPSQGRRPGEETARCPRRIRLTSTRSSTVTHGAGIHRAATCPTSEPKPPSGFAPGDHSSSPPTASPTSTAWSPTTLSEDFSSATGQGCVMIVVTLLTLVAVGAVFLVAAVTCTDHWTRRRGSARSATATSRTAGGRRSGSAGRRPVQLPP